MQTTYDWGAQLQDQPDIVLWAFHHLDVEHEITPVTHGHRLTLTYSICSTPDAKLTGAAAELAACSPFGRALQAALSTACWQPHGIELGFALGHLYPRHTREGFSPALLKGADAVMLAAAHQLHLHAEILPVWTTGREECRIAVGEPVSPAECGCAECCEGRPGLLSSRLAVGGDLEPLQVLQDQSFGRSNNENEDDALTKLRFPDGLLRPHELGVHWVRSDFRPQAALLAYGWGNEPLVDCMMSAAALIISVPPSSQRKTS